MSKPKPAPLPAGTVVGGYQIIKRLAAENPETEWRFEYSPEIFSSTEPEFAVEVCTSRCSTSGATWKRIFTSRDNAFPAVRPRPASTPPS